AGQGTPVPGADHGEVVHDSAVRGVDGSTPVGRDIDTAMEMAAGAARVVGIEVESGASESLRDHTVHRPFPATGRPGPQALGPKPGQLGLERGALCLHGVELLFELGFARLDLRLGGQALPAGAPQGSLVLLDGAD